MSARKREKPRKRAVKTRAPRSLVDAVNQGWEISEQLSSWKFRGANKREGFFILFNKKVSPHQLMVRYTALYELGQPYFLEED